MFEIICQDQIARLGKLGTRHGVLSTPAVFPVHDLGSDSGGNTPRYWEKFQEMNTAMFNAAILSMNRRSHLGRMMEMGVHRFIRFFGVAFIDSGGFVYNRYRLRTKPEQILRIQERMGADIASTLDFPISHKMLSENNRITLTVKNAMIADSIREDRDMLLYASINGYDPAVLKNVVKHLERKCEFDGYALGSMMLKRTDYRLLVDSILAVRREIRDKPLHVYGLGSPLITNLLTYLGVDSFDSSFFVISSGKRNYSVPGQGRITFSELEKLPSLPCDCSICASHGLEELRAKRELLCFHNLSVLFREISETKQAISENRIEEHLIKRFKRNPWGKLAFRFAKKRVRLSR